MEESQEPRPRGQKRHRDNEDDDQDLSITKRLLRYTGEIVKRAVPAYIRYPTTHHQVRKHDTRPFVYSGAGFPQFSRLPPELRFQIWRETWEHRDVNLTRGVGVFRLGEPYDDRREIDLYCYHLAHIRANQQHWDIQEHESHDCRYLRLPTKFVVTTRSTTRPPLSLWVNRESRRETLRHFELALMLPDRCPTHTVPCKHPGSRTFVFFNFDIDRLVFPLHHPLQTAFTQLDLSRLRRISIPELAPALPKFARHNSLLERPAPHILPEVDGEDEAVCYGEFKYVWRLLRQWFPSLREIHLDKFTDCERYGHSKENPVSEHRRKYGGYFNHGLHAIHRCHSCYKIHNSILRSFPKLGLGLGYDMDCIFEGHDIVEPVFEKQTLIIGQVKSGQGKKDENVTVTFWAIHDASDHSSVFDLEKRGTDWAQVRRQVVAKTLEHALGPPSKHEVMTYYINRDAMLHSHWDNDD
ncbi:uncharacterized protein GGS22DRAFT_159420 [Annulohypoxylon maeteangense]|uniref:uncharacterized protein n=1 Tax=Annulohypoxylon maeteangense TaxID=1927788 RepID=UPI002008395B|nr:uncharacterized protein GGS22DRAFT_159420 [Annulohypoxylon maeteangense]KAI0885949.1 hypothetical protein GGS22DRAFT_159420 [Annulohypoxylon maeteangense]